jgi:ABC-type proline/glycine betaine transport system permease subunit
VITLALPLAAVALLAQTRTATVLSIGDATPCACVKATAP